MRSTVKNDLLLTGILLGLFLLFLLVFWMLRKDGATVEIRQNGILIASLPLQEDTVYTVEGEEGYNLVVIQNEQVFIQEADCKNQLCVKQGRIQYAGESIVCLPHQLIVEIVGPKGPSVDGITGGGL